MNLNLVTDKATSSAELQPVAKNLWLDFLTWKAVDF